MILFHDRCWADSESQMFITSNKERLSLVAEGHWEQALWEIQRSVPVVLHSNLPSSACEVFLGSVQLSQSAVCDLWFLAV